MDALTAFNVQTELIDSSTPPRGGGGENHAAPSSTAFPLRSAIEREDFLDRLSGTASESPNSGVLASSLGSGGREENDLSRYENHQSSPQQPRSPTRQLQSTPPQLQPRPQTTSLRARPNVDALLEMLDDASSRLTTTTTTMMVATDSASSAAGMGDHRRDGDFSQDSIDGILARKNHEKTSRFAEEQVGSSAGAKSANLIEEETEDDVEKTVKGTKEANYFEASSSATTGETMVHLSIEEPSSRPRRGDHEEPAIMKTEMIEERHEGTMIMETQSVVAAKNESLVMHNLTVETDTRFLSGSSPGASPTTMINGDDQRQQPLTPNFPLVNDDHHPLGDRAPTSPSSHAEAKASGGVIIDRYVHYVQSFCMFISKGKLTSVHFGSNFVT